MKAAPLVTLLGPDGAVLFDSSLTRYCREHVGDARDRAGLIEALRFPYQPHGRPEPLSVENAQGDSCLLVY